MRALILAAGHGTRLRPLTDTCAKPAIPVAGEPIIRRIIRWLVHHGFDDLVVNLHYLPHTVTRVVGDGSDLGAIVRYSWEQPEVLGSGGGPRQALDILGDDTFLIVNGDTLTDLDPRSLVEAHRATDAAVTLALVPNREPGKYGGVLMAADGTVSGFAPRDRAQGTLHFIGVQVVQAEAFRRLPPGQPARTTGGLYETLIAERRGAIRGFVSETAEFWDIGTLDEYESTSAELAKREAVSWPGPHPQP